MNLRLSSRLRRGLTVVSAVALAAGMAGLTASTATAASASTAHTPPHVSIAKELSHGAHARQPAMTKADSRSRHACAAVIVVGHESCMLLKRDGLRPILATAAADLATYRSSAGLPPVPSFEKLNQNGATSPLPAEAPASDDWTLEESLDLDMASAICPLCNIVLVEATSDSGTGLDVAENAGANVAGYISNSWGGGESSSDTTLDSTDFNHPGSVITASAGDSDFGVIYPATSPNVVAVGGTRLSTASNSRGWTESVWNTSTGSEGTGSGCSTIE